VGVLARVPLASGLLSGKYKPGVEFPADDVRAGHDRALREARLAEVERIAREEVPAGMAMSQWALAWCLKNPAVTAVIPGCKSVEQVRTNASAGDIELQ
jgi:aryl-alcohol dehydrogenase-like predicted oxidoreductase